MNRKFEAVVSNGEVFTNDSTEFKVDFTFLFAGVSPAGVVVAKGWAATEVSAQRAMAAFQKVHPTAKFQVYTATQVGVQNV